MGISIQLRRHLVHHVLLLLLLLLILLMILLLVLLVGRLHPPCSMLLVWVHVLRSSRGLPPLLLLLPGLWQGI